MPHSFLTLAKSNRSIQADDQSSIYRRDARAVSSVTNDFIVDQFIYFERSNTLVAYLGATYRPRNDAEMLVDFLE